MNIIISGLSASGKSTVVRYIAKKFKYKHIHTSYVLKQFSNNENVHNIKIDKTRMNKGKYHKQGIDLKRVDNKNIDLLLDKYLLELVDKKDKLVMDSWTLAYLCKSKNILKIWLHASVKERTKRFALRSNISLIEASKEIKKKDNFSKKTFKELYDFDLGKNLTVFDYVLNTNNLSLKEVCKNIENFVKTKI